MLALKPPPLLALVLALALALALALTLALALALKQPPHAKPGMQHIAFRVVDPLPVWFLSCAIKFSDIFSSF